MEKQWLLRYLINPLFDPTAVNVSYYGFRQDMQNPMRGCSRHWQPMRHSVLLSHESSRFKTSHQHYGRLVNTLFIVTAHRIHAVVGVVYLGYRSTFCFGFADLLALVNYVAESQA